MYNLLHQQNEKVEDFAGYKWHVDINQEV
jgi:hypothetical protein